MDQQQQHQQMRPVAVVCGKRRFSDGDDADNYIVDSTTKPVVPPTPDQPTTTTTPVVVLKSTEDVQQELYALMLLLSVLSNRISAFDNAKSGQVQNIEETVHTSFLTTSELVNQMMEYRQLLTMAKSHFGYANFDFDSIIANMHDIARLAKPMIEAEGMQKAK